MGISYGSFVGLERRSYFLLLTLTEVELVELAAYIAALWIMNPPGPIPGPPPHWHSGTWHWE